MTLILLKTINRFVSLKSIHFTSKQNISYLLTKLNHKKVIGLKGSDSYDYIQGLVTNDIRHLCPTPETSVTHDCIYSFVLNTSGRIITDVFIYKQDFRDNSKNLFIEIDSHLLDSMAKYLNSYRIRRQIDIDVKHGFEVWSLFPSVDQFNEETIRELSDNDTTVDATNTEDMFVVRDPRLKEMGFRLLVDNKHNESEEQIKDKIKCILKSLEISETNVDNYDRYRYRLGVGEGVKDFPIETCFPLESNGDFLHAISFQKGCYVGQELTARVFHTGVIRKRLMPIEIIGLKDKVIESNGQTMSQNITTNDNKNCGKLRSISGAYGLALLRVDDVLKAQGLQLSQTRYTIKCIKPFWWPKEFGKAALASERVSPSPN